MEQYAQGDSISRDVSSPTVTDFTGWTGKWAVITKAGGTILKSGDMTISESKTKLQCRIPPYDGEDVLPVSKPFIEMQVESIALAFRKTLPLEQIDITPQAIL